MIHRYKLNGYNIVLDVNSGSVFDVHSIVYDILGDECIKNAKTYKDLGQDIFNKYNENDIKDAFDEIKNLQKNGSLFSENYDMQALKGIKRNANIKALCLHIAHDCNLKCEYCFASTGSFNRQRSKMSLEVGKKAIDFVIENSGNRKNIEIDFFGGEPLLNFEVVKQIISYAKQKGKETGKNFRFTITTNGILLTDDIIDYINENMDNVVLSLDGTKNTNDNVRKRLDDTGSYDSIVPKYLNFAQKRGEKDYFVRGTFTAYNTNFVDDVIHLLDLGFKNISVEPVVADEKMPYTLKEEHLPKIFDQYEKLAQILIDKHKKGFPFNFFHFMLDLSGGPCIYKRITGCGAGFEYLAVTPEGDIYPCHQFVSNEKYKMGSVFDGILNQQIKNTFENSNVYTKEKCMDCFCKFYCSGGCPANAVSFNNDINTPYEIGCEMQKKRVECAIMTKLAGL